MIEQSRGGIIDVSLWCYDDQCLGGESLSENMDVARDHWLKKRDLAVL